jgi:hypothetical protein
MRERFFRSEFYANSRLRDYLHCFGVDKFCLRKGGPIFLLKTSLINMADREHFFSEKISRSDRQQ